MKARIIRLLFATHRWTGVVLGLLMLLWCLSGFVLIWAPYPSLTLGDRDYRAEGLAPLLLPERLVFPPVPEGASITSLRMEMLAERPVVSLAWREGEGEGEGGGRGLFDLSTGERIEKVDEAEALDVARIYAERHGLKSAPSLKVLTDRPDEFTVQGYLNPHRPLYQMRLNDPEQTMLYISSATGEAVQRTTASLRTWTWLGAIPHWLYFTELRTNAALWNQVVIWTSLAGCVSHRARPVRRYPPVPPPALHRPARLALSRREILAPHAGPRLRRAGADLDLLRLHLDAALGLARIRAEGGRIGRASRWRSSGMG